MANLSINPVIVLPTLQITEDFCTTATDSEAASTSFSDVFSEAVNSQPSPQEDFKAPATPETSSPEDNSVQQGSPATQEPQPTVPQTNASPSPAAGQQNQSLQPDKQETVSTDQSQPQPQVASNNKTKDTKTKPATTAADTLTIADLWAQIATEIQPLTAVANPAASVATDSLTESVSQVVTNDFGGAGSDPRFVFNGVNSKEAFTGVLNLQTATPTSTQTQTPMLTLPQPATADQTIVVQPAANSVQTGASPVTPAATLFQSAATTTTVQNLGDLANLPINVAVNQAPTVGISSQSKTTADSEPEFNGLLNFKVADLNAIVVNVKGGSTENTGNSSTKDTGSQTGLVNPNLLQTAGSKDNIPITTDFKGTQFGNYSPSAIQVTGNEGKSPALNLPLIQTQLSVGSSNDKDRTDIPVISAVNQQPATTVVDSDTAPVPTANHVNSDDLLSQIVDKTKILINNGHSEMEVSLKPDSLGKLQLKISVDNQTVTAKFVAESQQVKEIIETNLNQLRRNLQENGVQVDKLMVSVGQQNSGNDFQQSANYQGAAAGNNNLNSTQAENEAETSSGDNSQENPSLRETLIDYVA